jgi:uncharacterized protein YndB with AHSA1/START domain
MATAQLTPDGDAVLAEIFISAPPARVFEALTDPAQRSQWWGEGAVRLTENQADLRVGGKWFSDGLRADGKTFRMEGEYLEIDPPRLLVYTHNFPGYMTSTVRCELEPRDVHGMHTSGLHRVGTGTVVKIRHYGFAKTPEQAESHRNGWSKALGWLQVYVEKGETIENRKIQ